MRIAHVSDCYLPRTGGIETQVRGLALAQAARGHYREDLLGQVDGREPPDLGGERDAIASRPQAFPTGSANAERRARTAFS